MHHLSRGTSVLAALLLAAGSTAAQGTLQIRDGLWFGAGAGYGSAGFSCDSCASIAREGGVGGFVRVGGTVSERLLLGVDVAAFKTDTLTLGHLTLSAFLYPTVGSGLYFKVGGGFSIYGTTSGSHVKGFGGAATLGAGYNIRVRSNISITPSADYVYGDINDLDIDGIIRDAGWKQNLFLFGLSVIIH